MEASPSLSGTESYVKNLLRIITVSYFTLPAAAPRPQSGNAERFVLRCQNQKASVAEPITAT